MYICYNTIMRNIRKLVINEKIKDEKDHNPAESCRKLFKLTVGARSLCLPGRPMARLWMWPLGRCTISIKLH